MKPGIKFLHSLFEVTDAEFQAYDVTNRKLVFSSGLAHQMLGYPADEIFDLSDDFFKKIIHPDDFHIVEETIRKLIQSKKGEVVEMTARVRRIDGNYIWIYSRQMIHERRPDSNICTIITETEDITKLVELENELKKKAEQIQAISYKNSHLLRSPVSTIIGLLHLIEEQGITSEHNRQILHFLKDTISKLDNIIHEINDAAKSD